MRKILLLVGLLSAFNLYLLHKKVMMSAAQWRQPVVAGSRRPKASRCATHYGFEFQQQSLV